MHADIASPHPNSRRSLCPYGFRSSRSVFIDRSEEAYLSPLVAYAMRPSLTKESSCRLPMLGSVVTCPSSRAAESSYTGYKERYKNVAPLALRSLGLLNQEAGCVLRRILGSSPRKGTYTTLGDIIKEALSPGPETGGHQQWPLEMRVRRRKHWVSTLTKYIYK